METKEIKLLQTANHAEGQATTAPTGFVLFFLSLRLLEEKIFKLKNRHIS